MSYGFNVRGATVAAAVGAVAPKFDEVVTSQPVHANDRDAAVATAYSMAGLLGEPGDGQEVSISVSGSLGWTARTVPGEVPDTFTSASVSVQAYHVTKAE